MYGLSASEYSAISLSREHAALAGLVEGRLVAFIPFTGSIYLRYNSNAFLPLQKIAAISALSKISERSLGTTLLMLASEEPFISQLAIESQSAML